ncbi:MAG: hypothetical protein ABI051_08435 [Vicinamibacterales bacterium]
MRLLLLLLPVTVFAACEQAKSATPLSPSIAGPIAGVEISAPGPVSPSAGTKVAADTQPITLVVQNASSNGVRPLNYVFQVASDSGFSSVVFSQTGVTPGEGGRTQLRLPQPLAAERVYYWRVRAIDGANEGEFSAAADFTVFTPVVIGIPALTSPADGATVATNKPTLDVNNASVSGPAGAIHYLFEVATDGGMGNRVAVGDVLAGSGHTSFVPNELAASTRFFWRVRAFDFARVGEWSAVRSFVTPAAAAGPTPPQPGTPTPAPNDDIDVRNISVVKGEDIRGWAVTSTITSAGRSGGDLCINHTKAGRWPTVGWFGDNSVLVEGNQWFFANIGGKWYGGANEWLRPGQICKNMDGHVGQGGYGGTLLESWTPAPGEIVGVAMSTPARAGQWTTAERTNIVLIRW